MQETPMRCRFNPWVGKIPWRRKWQPTPVFLPRKSHGQESLEGYSPGGCGRTWRNWACMHDNNQCQLGLSWANGVTATLQQAAGLREPWVQMWGEGRHGRPHWRLWREPKLWAPEHRCCWAAGLSPYAPARAVLNGGMGESLFESEF